MSAAKHETEEDKDNIRRFAEQLARFFMAHLDDIEARTLALEARNRSESNKKV